jgi:Beta-lactamase enzyme family/Putative peptidoglycan binding domain
LQKKQKYANVYISKAKTTLLKTKINNMFINYPLLYLHGWRPSPKHALVSWWARHKHVLVLALEVVGIATTIFLVLNVVLFALEYNRLPVFTSIDGLNIGLKREAAARSLLDTQFAEQEIALNVSGVTHSVLANSAGVTQDLDKTMQIAKERKGWRRVPVVNAFANYTGSLQPRYTVNSVALTSALDTLVKSEQKAPQDAKLLVSVQNPDDVSIVESQNGYVINAKIAADQVTTSVRHNNDFVVEINKETIEPNITTTDLAPALTKAKSVAKAHMQLQAGNKQVALSDADVRALLTIREVEGGNPVLTLVREDLVAKLKSLAGTFYRAPVATTITLLDGNTVSTSEGAAGQTLDVEKTADAMIASFEANTLNVSAKLADIASPKSYKRTYSNSSEGLYKLIEQFAKTHSGSYKVAAVELKDGQTRSAFYAADDQIITASTFKVFVAYVALLKIEQGVYTLDTQTELGSIDYCMRRMLIPSADDCALALQHLIGWSEIDRVLAAAGFGSTDLNNSTGGDKYSTARDEMKLLTKLYNGELLSASSVDYLFSIMDDQIYRSGIIAGSRGTRAPSKVGILYGLRHDIGVVYGPKTTYALVILTNNAGGSFTNVKLLAEQIYDFYNQ